MATLPERVVRCAGPADHSAGEKKAEEGNDDHTERRPADVRNGIQGDLSAESSGGVSTDFRDERVSGFVARGGEKKNDVRDETGQENSWGEIRHRHVRLGFRREESKPRWRRGGG